jgi:predicted MFS family arabinose efflux permease
MMNLDVAVAGKAADKPAAWGAVLALSLGAFTLVASEFMPVAC